MVRFLQWLSDHVALVNLADVPQVADRVKEGETFVGELPDELKRLWAVYTTYTQNIQAQGEIVNMRLEEILSGNVSLACEGQDRELGFLNAASEGRQEIIGKIFWQGVREQFPDALIFAGRQPALRKGWQVVALPRQKKYRKKVA